MTANSTAMLPRRSRGKVPTRCSIRGESLSTTATPPSWCGLDMEGVGTREQPHFLKAGSVGDIADIECGAGDKERPRIKDPRDNGAGRAWRRGFVFEAGDVELAGGYRVADRDDLV